MTTVEANGSAVVIGASIAGLTVARALSDTFAKVTIVERDALPDQVDVRRGIPQAKHLHGLLARGLAAFEELFPGFGDELVAAGAIPGDIQSDLHWYINGNQLKPALSGMVGIASSRPLLEATLRARVAGVPAVEFRDNCDVLSLLTSQDRRRVTGVLVRSRMDGSDAVGLEADLVVDASGRGSRTPIWLEELGYRRPPENKITVDTTYVTRWYRRESHHLDGRLGVNATAYPGLPRGGILLAQENDRFIFTTTGMFGEQPPMDDAGLMEFAESLPTREFTTFLHTATRFGEPVKMRYPANVRHRYEKLNEFPAGYLVVGDALCSFNPIYGQGMTIAAVEGQMVRDLLRAGPHELASRFFGKAAKLTEIAWMIAAGSDTQFPQAKVALPPHHKVLNRYLRRLHRAASNDATVATAFMRVLNLMDTPEKLMAPTVVRRVAKPLPRNAV